jgi:hypothetical protein
MTRLVNSFEEVLEIQVQNMHNGQIMHGNNPAG